MQPTTKAKQTEKDVLVSLSWTGVALLCGFLTFLIFNESLLKSFLAAVVVSPAVVFLCLGSKKIPSIYLALFVCVTIFNVTCMGWGLYAKFDYMDDLAHFATAFALVPPAFYALFGRAALNVLAKSPGVVWALGFALGLAVGSVWEVMEFVLSVEATYTDTIFDLIWDSSGAGLAALWVVRRLCLLDSDRQ